VSDPRFHPPRQHRSQETLGRILDAAEQLLDEKSFSGTPLTEIVERAGVTVGAFYRRFPDKDALLHHLDERFFADIHARVDHVLDPARVQGWSAAQVAAEFAAHALDVYRTRRGLLRSVFLRLTHDAVLQESARQVNRHMHAALTAALLARRAQLRLPDPERTIGLALMVLVGALREIVLFGEIWSTGVDGADPALEAELQRVFTTTLGTDLS
jgi:AcrR family transcriptional regulator